MGRKPKELGVRPEGERSWPREGRGAAERSAGGKKKPEENPTIRNCANRASVTVRQEEGKRELK